MNKNLPFEKWQATGNDFILASERLATELAGDIRSLSRAMCDRHYGIGSDGLLLVGSSGVADFRMRMWNPDGSESEMCGNGLRCVGGHLVTHGLISGSDAFFIETAKGVVSLDFPSPPGWADRDLVWVRVDMGEPILEPKRIQIAIALEQTQSPPVQAHLTIPETDKELLFTAVGMGNPHAVAFVDDVDSVPLEEWGPKLENQTNVFPNRVNVEFVQVLDRDHLKVRVWERGAGITKSCGSGACAVQVASLLAGKAGERVRIDLPGGSLLTEYTEGGKVTLSGPAEKVFTGEWVRGLTP